MLKNIAFSFIFLFSLNAYSSDFGLDNKIDINKELTCSAQAFKKQVGTFKEYDTDIFSKDAGSVIERFELYSDYKRQINKFLSKCSGKFSLLDRISFVHLAMDLDEININDFDSELDKLWDEYIIQRILAIKSYINQANVK